MYKSFAHLDQFIGNVKINSIDDKLNELLIQRSNQLCLSFSYFGLIKIYFFSYYIIIFIGIPQPRA